MRFTIVLALFLAGTQAMRINQKTTQIAHAHATNLAQVELLEEQLPKLRDVGYNLNRFIFGSLFDALKSFCFDTTDSAVRQQRWDGLKKIIDTNRVESEQGRKSFHQAVADVRTATAELFEQPAEEYHQTFLVRYEQGINEAYEKFTSRAIAALPFAAEVPEEDITAIKEAFNEAKLALLRGEPLRQVSQQMAEVYNPVKKDQDYIRNNGETSLLRFSTSIIYPMQ